MSYFQKNVASRMAVNGRRRNINAMEFPESTEYVLVAENEAIEDTMIIREDEIMHYGGNGRNESLFEEMISQPIETMRPTKKVTTNFVDAERIKEEWFEEVDVDEIDTMSPTDEGSNSMVQCQANTSDELNEGEDDEETVAVFVTASGQQLALYAVEDSDDIFAVAMYDESGNPPSHFQFLMKSDVERLIVEGAVRTVKKPSQIKKELITDEPVSFIPKRELLSRNLSATDSHIEEEAEEDDNDDEHDAHLIYHRTKRDWNERILPDSNTDDEIHFDRSNKNRSVPNVIVKKSSNEEKLQKASKIVETENEILEQSTVQYIFLESDQTESELTFDDIQTTLRNFKFSNNRRANVSDATSTDYPKSPENIDTTYHSSDKEDDTNFELNFEEESFSSVETTHFSLIDTTTNDSFNLQTSHVKQEVETPKKDTASDLNGAKTLTFKTKRSRKQQFTSVNRGDSEIIIQPASMFLEEEQENESVKKKKRRKRKLPIRGNNNNNSHNAKSIHSRKLRKRRKRRAVEVIELDTDEEERSPMVTRSKRDVVEIDLEGNNKEKYSSDKENEVILLADSDEEDEDASSSSSSDNRMKLSPLLRCKYCLRSFRQKSALETHVRLCPKSPANARRYEKKVRSNSSSNKSMSNKEYSCKICQEKFDVVVALARHVRFEHSLKKKANSANTGNKSNETPQTTPKTTTVKKVVKPPEEKVVVKEEKEEQKKQEKDSVEKRINRRTRMWDTKKHNCPDCGKWFPSAAILAAHCLQHATKNTEKQLRKCRSCKKMLRSRILYIQHMKMHSTAQNTVISLRRSYQRNPRNKRRVISSNTAIHRRRGKPRKW